MGHWLPRLEQFPDYGGVVLELKVKDCEKWVLPTENLDIFMIWAVKEEKTAN